MIKTAVKKWMPNRKKLAKGKPIANEVPTTAAVVRLDEPEDTSDDSEVFTVASEELQLPSEAEVNQTEVASVIEALKLTHENDSDIDSDFEDFSDFEHFSDFEDFDSGSCPFQKAVCIMN